MDTHKQLVSSLSVSQTETWPGGAGSLKAKQISIFIQCTEEQWSPPDPTDQFWIYTQLNQKVALLSSTSLWRPADQLEDKIVRHLGKN